MHKVQILRDFEGLIKSGEMLVVRMAKVMATIVRRDSRGLRCNLGF